MSDGKSGRVTRRRFAGLAVGAAAVPAAGCASLSNDETVACVGDCNVVEETSVDAFSGIDEYTDVTVRFRQRFTGTIFFDAKEHDETVFVKEFDVKEVRARTFEFDKYASQIQMEVTEVGRDA